MTEDFLRQEQLDGDRRRRFKISNRDQALFLVEERDLEAQLIAIKSALLRNQKAEQAVSEAIGELDAHIRNYAGGDGKYQMYIEDQWVDTLHDSVFQDAAHSMAAVGMLVPFVDSLFVSIFAGLRHRREKDDSPDGADVRRTMSNDEFWDPHYVFEKGGRRTDLVAGITQLATCVGLNPFLPDNFQNMLAALFEYRDRMLHHGFEWPLEERYKFEERIKSEGWPAEWFQKATSGGEPWIFYLSAEFTEYCLITIDQIIEGTGKYLYLIDEL